MMKFTTEAERLQAREQYVAMRKGVFDVTPKQIFFSPFLCESEFDTAFPPIRPSRDAVIAECVSRLVMAHCGPNGGWRRELEAVLREFLPQIEAAS